MSIHKCGIYVIVGASLYFCAPFVFYRIGDPGLTCAACMILTAAGFYLLYIGARQLLRIWRPAATDDPFGLRKGGFPQQEGLVEGELSFHLPAEYEYKGQKRKAG